MKKKIISVILAAAVAAGAIAGIASAVRATTSSAAVMVIQGTEINYGGYYWNESSSYGMVASDATQNIYLNDTETVKAVYVEQGQEVKEGDILLEFDTAQTSIGLEKEKLNKQQIELDIQVAQTNLETLSRLSPYVEPSGGDVIIPDEEPDPDEEDPDEDALKKEMIEIIQASSLSDEIKEALIAVLEKESDADGSSDADAALSKEELQVITDGIGKLQKSGKEEDLKALLTILNGINTDTLRTVIENLWKTSTSDTASESQKKQFRELFDKMDKETAKAVVTAVFDGDALNTEESRQFLIDLISAAAEKDPDLIAELVQNNRSDALDQKLREILGSGNDPSDSDEITAQKVIEYIRNHADSMDEETKKALIELLGGTIADNSAGDAAEDPSTGDGNTSGSESGSTDNAASEAAGSGSETTAFNIATCDFSAVFADYKKITPVQNVLLADSSSGLISSGAQYSASELKQAKVDEQQKLDALQIDLKESELRISQTEEALQEGVIRAKMNGIVKTLQDVNNPPADGSAVMVVSGTKGLYIRSAVSEENLSQLHEGDIVTVTSWQTGNMYEAAVKDISPYPDTSGEFSSDSSESCYPFTAYIDSDAADLQEGEYLQVNMDFSTTSEDAGGGDGFYLYKPFIRDENGQKYVYIRDEAGKLAKQYVTVGTYNGSGYEILSGATENDWFAFPYGSGVKEGVSTREGTLEELYES